MSAVNLRDQISDEIGRIPDSRLAELFDLLHFFRIGLEATHAGGKENVMQFAGAWQDMAPQEFERFSQETAARRRSAFSQRAGRDDHIG